MLDSSHGLVSLLYGNKRHAVHFPGLMDGRVGFLSSLGVWKKAESRADMKF